MLYSGKKKVGKVNGTKECDNLTKLYLTTAVSRYSGEQRIVYKRITLFSKMDFYLMRAMSKCNIYRRINDCYRYGERFLIQKLIKFMVYLF